MGEERGQAAVELVAALPALLLAAIVALQLLAAGYAMTLAEVPPRRGRWRSPRAVRRRRRYAGPCRAGRRKTWGRVEGGTVTVRLRPPSPLHSLADRLAVTSTASARPAR